MTGWKSKIVDEMVEYFLNFVYLAFFLVAFTWYRRLILAEYAISYSNYWVPLIEAAVLANVIMVGDLMRLGRRRLERTPCSCQVFTGPWCSARWWEYSASWNTRAARYSTARG